MDRLRRGALVARALHRSWGQPAPALALPAGELQSVLAPVLRDGSAGLLWRRLRADDATPAPAIAELRDAYRNFALQAALRERDLAAVFSTLRSAGIEPLLSKGWAIARRYPEPGLRPYGDLDLCVPAEQLAFAAAALQRDNQNAWVDLHVSFSGLEDRSLAELLQASHLVRLGSVEVRVPCDEDLLRHLSIHLLRHGAWRPLWLCDIAVLLDGLPANFDWDRCLRGPRQRADWVACVAGLAHRLLGARLENPLLLRRARELPAWLERAVLREWGSVHRDHGELDWTTFRRPLRLLQALKERWPNPIRATILLDGSFGRWPPFYFQLASYAVRAVQLTRRRQLGHA